MKNFIAYYRVSTAKQGQSGLGLEAQKATAQTFAASRGQIVEEYIEIESGKKSDRPKLAAAIAQSKATGATLLIAKLDRLSREVRFIFELRDNRVDFVACDLPEANTLTIGVFASFAQFEREQIAARTKAAFKAKQAQGFGLGNPANLTPAARLRGLQVRQQNAREHVGNRQATELAGLYRGQGLTLQAIADKLNSSGYTTRRGRQFGREQVRRLLVRGAESRQIMPTT